MLPRINSLLLALSLHILIYYVFFSAFRHYEGGGGPAICIPITFCGKVCFSVSYQRDSKIFIRRRTICRATCPISRIFCFLGSFYISYLTTLYAIFSSVTKTLCHGLCDFLSYGISEGVVSVPDGLQRTGV